MLAKSVVASSSPDNGGREPVDLEREGVAAGARRFDRKNRAHIEGGHASRTAAVYDLGVLLTKDVAAAIDKQLPYRRGRPPAWKDKLRPELGSEEIARTTLNCMCDFIYTRPELRDVTLLLGKRFERLMANRRAKVDHRTPFAWTDDERHNIGYWFILIACESTGAWSTPVTLEQTWGRWRHHRRLVPDKRIAEWVRSRNDKLRLLVSVHGPMATPPIPWGLNQVGGYRGEQTGDIPLIANASDAVNAAALGDPAMSPTFGCLNRHQQTAWRIEHRVLAIAEMALEGRLQSLVPKMDKPMAVPKWPGKHASQKHKSDYSTQARPIHKYNESIADRRTRMVCTVANAARLRLEGALYYVWNSDASGRCNPIVGGSELHPHGSGLAQGLLRFAYPSTQTADGATTFLLYGAHLLGADPTTERPVREMSYAERLKLVAGLHEQFEAAARDPIGVTWWTSAPHPWQLLAWIYAYADQEHVPGNLTFTPCRVDRTASHLQHLAELQNDTDAFTALNMTGEKPSDLYTAFTRTLVYRLTIANAHRPEARTFIQVVGTEAERWRTIVKSAITLPLLYGGVASEAPDRVFETLRKSKDGALFRKLVTACKAAKITPTACVKYLAAEITAIVRTRLSRPLALTQWLADAGVAAAKLHGGVLSWRSPATSFPVRVERWQERDDQAQVGPVGRRFAPKVWTPTDRPDLRKLASVVGPAVGQSLESATMVTAVNKLPQGNVSSVHDCFIAAAPNMPALNEAIRSAFAEVHKGDALAFITNQWGLPSDFPPPPVQRDAVKQSDFTTAAHFAQKRRIVHKGKGAMVPPRTPSSSL